MDKSHKDPKVIDMNVPRHAQYLHNAWKRHQDAVYWVDINLAIKKGLTFYQTRSNAIILQETLPAYCIPKCCQDENWRSLIQKSNHVTSASAKDLIETRMEKIILIQVVIERGNPLLEPIERGNPLLELRMT